MDAVKVLREYGQAMRGDWSEVDGRTVRDDLDWIADWIESPATAPTLTDMRGRLDLCPAGFGHWIHFCDNGCKENT